MTVLVDLAAAVLAVLAVVQTLAVWRLRDRVRELERLQTNRVLREFGVGPYDYDYGDVQEKFS